MYIESYSFGRVTVDGVCFTKDVLVFNRETDCGRKVAAALHLTC